MLFVQLCNAILIIVLAGTCNMMFVKLPILQVLHTPMDMGHHWRDGKRLLGDNKTWKGFVGMILFTGLWFALFAAVAKVSDSFAAASLFPFRDYSTAASFAYGAIWGFGYVAAELPNSFVKRRLNIRPGERADSAWRPLFIFIDQADSPLGCCLVMCVFYTPLYLALAGMFVLGVGIHFLMNFALFALGLKQAWL